MAYSTRLLMCCAIMHVHVKSEQDHKGLEQLEISWTTNMDMTNTFV